MAFGVFAAAYTAGGSPYNVWDVLTGKQTTGVTKKTGATLQTVSLPPNQSFLRLTVTREVAGIVYVGDSAVSATNKNGVPIYASLTAEGRLSWGESEKWIVSLHDVWFAVDTDTVVVVIEFR